MQHALRLLPLAHGLLACVVEEDLGLMVDRGDGLDAIGLCGDDHLFAAAQTIERIRGDAVGSGVAVGIDDRGHAETSVGFLLHDRADVELPIDQLQRVLLLKLRTGQRQPLHEEAHIPGHRAGFQIDVALVFVVIAAGQLVGVLEDPALVVGEPGTARPTGTGSWRRPRRTASGPPQPARRRTPGSRAAVQWSPRRGGSPSAGRRVRSAPARE